MRFRIFMRNVARILTRQPLMTAIIGGVVVLGLQFAWDWYRESRELTLTYESSSVLADRVHAPDSLHFLYGKDTIPGLTRLAFSLANTGRNPITTDDISVPPFVRIGGSSVLLSRVELQTPQEMTTTLTLDLSRTTISIVSPLLNPGDRIDFAIYVADSRIPKVESGIHAKGIHRLTFVDGRPNQGATRKWLSPSVLLFLVGEGYLLLNLSVLLMSVGYERRARKTWTGGTLRSRSGISAGYFIGMISSLFSEHPDLIRYVQQQVSPYHAETILPTEVWARLSGEVTYYVDQLRHALTRAALANVAFIVAVAIYFIAVTR